MKKIITAALAAASLAAVAAPAAAQPFMGINQRQANLDQRIDMGVRNGSLTRREAFQLRTEFRQLQLLENRYRRGGLTAWERSDLDRRFNVLSARIRFERHDRQDRPFRH